MCPISPENHFIRTSEGRTYKRLRDPEIADDVQRGKADVGFLGSDKIWEWRPKVAVDWIGEVPNCDFVLASRLGTAQDVQVKLANGEMVTAVTSNPIWLGAIAVDKGWSLTIEKKTGSVEAYGNDADMIADLRVRGDSLRDNQLEEFAILERVKLGLISPIDGESILGSSGPLLDVTGYLASLATIVARAAALQSGQAAESYTQQLLADQNKRIKKLGTETVELVREECRPDFDAERFLSEAADLVYSTEVMVAARGLPFVSVLNELVRRNKQARSS